MFTTMRLLTCSVALALLAGFVACTGGSLDLGSSDASTPPSSDAGGVGTTRWTGYLENYKLPSGSDAIVLEITSGNDAALNGTVVFGSRVLLPPTDPNVGYPPGFPGAGGFAGEGFAYHLRGGARTNERMTFGLAEVELWNDWCVLQTPFEVDPGYYKCLPNTGVEQVNNQCFLLYEDAGKSPIDCGKMGLCTSSQVCACTASGCVAGPGIDIATLKVDLAVVGDKATGTLAGLPPTGQQVNVHLTRVR